MAQDDSEMGLQEQDDLAKKDSAREAEEVPYDPVCSDLNLIVEGERIPVHRSILIASGEYFR